jgi:hypothetical protein
MRLIIELPVSTAERLVRVAVQEHRPLWMQAEIEIERALSAREAAKGAEVADAVAVAR